MSITEIPTEHEGWAGRAGRTLNCYREELLRKVAAKLIRPRAMWTPDELRERMTAALEDPVTMDRALRNVSPSARQLLRLIDLSQQPVWRLQPLADLLIAIGHQEGIGPVVELLETGLAYPLLEGTLPVESFESWLAPAASVPLKLFVIPLAAERCRAEALAWNAPAVESKPELVPIESDGLEILLRLAVLWQVVNSGPIRLTQSGGLFKRDLDRLRSDPLLSAAPPDAAHTNIKLAVLTVELGRAIGMLATDDDQLLPGQLPESWDGGLQSSVQEIWPALFSIEYWDADGGFAFPHRVHFQTLTILLVAALLEANAQKWLSAAALAKWLTERNPEWECLAEELSAACVAILWGVLHPLRLIQVAIDGDARFCRLTPMGRSLLSHASAPPNPAIVQTLLVQPNLEVILFRQGLTPALTATLTRFAEWKSLGLACTLSLTAQSVYRGLETGLSLAMMQRTLERHATRPLPDAVVEMLRSWASKRERVQVYPAAILLEFRNAAELDQAVKLGLVEQKLTDRIGMVADESQIDFTRFRLVGTRDYLAVEEKCIEVHDDGLTLSANDGRADLLFGAEVRRFADVIESTNEDKSLYRMSVASLRRARESGIDLPWLDDWFTRRAGAPLPSTCRMLFLGRDVLPSSLKRLVILRAPTVEVADGIERWPDATRLSMERLGPTSFAVPEEQVSELRQLLASADLRIEEV